MSTATDMLALYLAAEEKILGGQSTSINGRALTRANLAEVVIERREWERRVAAESRQATGNYGERHQLADFSE